MTEPDGAQATATEQRRRREPPTLPDGILLVAKEPGPTSHDIVALVRRLSGVRRVGHGGTLDPFAAGVLPVFVGQATRLAEYHLGDDKQYSALVAFGARSTTDDLQGELTPIESPAPSREAVADALHAFEGRIEQVPPDYSAVHVGGRRAYELARHGRKPELRSRTVTIHALQLVDWDATDAQRPVATIEVRCSAGTYVRSLARDLGERLGCGAYLAALTRTASGPFVLADAHPLDTVRAALAEGRGAPLLLPPDAGIETPLVTLAARELAALLRGQAVPAGAATGGASSGSAEARPSSADASSTSAEASSNSALGELVRVLDEGGRLVAMGRLRDGRLQPEKVFLPRPD